LHAPKAQVAAARQANTANEILTAAREAGLPLADRVAERAQTVALVLAEHRVSVEVAVFDREGALAGRAPFGIA
jgi:cobalt-precorrin-5B (C1)-methyltransferase